MKPQSPVLSHCEVLSESAASKIVESDEIRMSSGKFSNGPSDATQSNSSHATNEHVSARESKCLVPNFNGVEVMSDVVDDNSKRVLNGTYPLSESSTSEKMRSRLSLSRSSGGASTTSRSYTSTSSHLPIAPGIPTTGCSNYRNVDVGTATSVVKHSQVPSLVVSNSIVTAASEALHPTKSSSICETKSTNGTDSMLENIAKNDRSVNTHNREFVPCGLLCESISTQATVVQVSAERSGHSVKMPKAKKSCQSRLKENAVLLPDCLVIDTESGSPRIVSPMSPSNVTDEMRRSKAPTISFNLPILESAFGVLSFDKLNAKELDRIFMSKSGMQDNSEDRSTVGSNSNQIPDFLGSANQNLSPYRNGDGWSRKKIRARNSALARSGLKLQFPSRKQEGSVSNSDENTSQYVCRKLLTDLDKDNLNLHEISRSGSPLKDVRLLSSLDQGSETQLMGGVSEKIFENNSKIKSEPIDAHSVFNIQQGVLSDHLENREVACKTLSSSCEKEEWLSLPGDTPCGISFKIDPTSHENGRFKQKAKKSQRTSCKISDDLDKPGFLESERSSHEGEGHEGFVCC